MSLLDFLFPKRCVGCKSLGSYLCPDCFTRISFSTSYICFACNRASLDGLTHPACRKAWMIDGLYSSLVYSGIVKKLVYQFKYRPHLTDLKPVLVELFHEGIIQQENLSPYLRNGSVLMPIPLFVTKQKKRGYNQAEVLARGMGQKLGLGVEDYLIRKRSTVSQFTLDREKRRANILDAFELKKGSGVGDATVLLVDDVVTSGATLIEAAKTLKRAGAKRVFGITLAHGQ